jgi:hypothetical protein
MPSIYNLPGQFNNVPIEAVNRFAQLPFYLVHNEIQQYAVWNEFDQVYGSIPWQENMGSTMEAVTPQRSPVGRSLFFPNPITTASNKDIYQISESNETAVLYKHKYGSFVFNFLPSFQIFWDKYIKFNSDDVVKQIAISNNQFIETQMLQCCIYVYLCGTGLIGGQPTGAMNSALNAAGSKTAAWLVATTLGTGNNTGVLQNLRLRDIKRAIMNLQDDLGAPSFNGSLNMPKDNEGLKGRYALFCSSEDYYNFDYDPDVNKFSGSTAGAGLGSINLDLLFNDFKGSLFGQLTCKIKKYPIRYNVVNTTDTLGNVLWPAGFPIDPEIFDPIDQKWKPNPYYTSLASAPFSIAWMLGNNFIKTLKVGPPPKEFATKNMSGEKFYSLRWNGEVRLTDQILITNPDGSIELNDFGENLQLKAQLTHGVIPTERRFAFPMLLARSRPAIQVN